MLARKTTNRFATSSNARIVHAKDVPVHESKERLFAALASEGFDVVADIDLAELLARRLDESREPFAVVEACHPKLAQLALDIAGDGALMMPFRFCIWKEGTGSTIATLPPARMAEALGLPHVQDMVADAEARLDRLFEHLDLSMPAACEIPAAHVPAAALALNEEELETLREATRRQTAALMAEVAGTESRPMQHELARTIDRLEALTHKLEIAGAPHA
ncbi:MAG TPA: DUF302 domain-containing protein [Polyangia bacterium]